MDHSCCPLPHGHQVRGRPVQPQQAQSCTLLDAVHAVPDVHAKHKPVTSETRPCSLILPLQFKYDFIFPLKPVKRTAREASDENYFYVVFGMFSEPSTASCLMSSWFCVCCTHPATRTLGISDAKVSAISLLPTLAMQCSARFMKVGLRLERSFLMPLLIRRIRSLLELTSTEMNRYP